MISAIDTNILLDILIPDQTHMEKSKQFLEKSLEKGQLIICEIVYAELASQFSLIQDLDIFLSETGITLINSNSKALSLAGGRWSNYAKHRGKGMTCPACGKKVEPTCQHCGSAIPARHRILSDFIIGAHALVHADLLISRDRGIYKTYFKDLKIIPFS